jgi:hypothetical protein
MKYRIKKKLSLIFFLVILIPFICSCSIRMGVARQRPPRTSAYKVKNKNSHSNSRDREGIRNFYQKLNNPSNRK